MKLTDLDAKFLKVESERSYRTDATMAEAQGVLLLCPICFVKNGGEVGTHSVVCWFRNKGVPDSMSPGPGRWDVSGTGIADLTLSPSVFLSGAGGCQWHGWIKNGNTT